MRAPYLILFGLLLVLLLFFVGYGISNLSFQAILILLIGFIVLALTIMNVEIGLYLLIFVLPFTQQYKFTEIPGPKFQVGTDDVFIIFIILSWLANLARRKEPIALKTSLNWPLFVFFTIAVFSFIGADVRFKEGTILLGVLHLLKFYEYVIIYFIVISTINNLEQVKKFLKMFLIVVGFIVLVQFVSMFIWGHVILAGTPMRGYPFVQTMFAFQSNTYLGAYYAFFLSIIIAMILERSRGEGRIPLILFAIVISFALFNTYSRSTYLGLFISFLIIAILKEKRLFLLILLLAVFSPIFFQEDILKRITFTVQAVRPTLMLDPSATIRLVVWKKGLQIFLNNFLFGTGYWTTRWALHAQAHSQYLAILIETGVVGFSIFCWLLVRMFKNSVALMKKAGTGFFKALGLGYTAGLAGILVVSFFSEPFEAFRITGFLWFLTGLITSANRLLSKKGEGSNESGSDH